MELTTPFSFLERATCSLSDARKAISIAEKSVESINKTIQPVNFKGKGILVLSVYGVCNAVSGGVSAANESAGTAGLSLNGMALSKGLNMR